MDGVVRRGAAPRYADTPTFSRMEAVATMLAASVRPKLYVQGATGLVPAPAMAERRVVTWTCSVLPMDLRFVMSVAVRPRAAKSESENLANPSW